MKPHFTVTVLNLLKSEYDKEMLLSQSNTADTPQTEGKFLNPT